MANAVGFRQCKLFENVTAGVQTIVDDSQRGAGSFLLFEVTNATATDGYFIVNDMPENGHPGTKIPVPKGTTRQIPMMVVCFNVTQVMTVVAYGM